VLARTAKEAMMMPMVGSVEIGYTFGGSLESGGRFCVGDFGRNLTSVALKMSSLSIYFIKKLYKFFPFSIQKCSFQSTLTTLR
jgi:hypothetical protein